MFRPTAPLFHLAIPAADLAQSKQFYCQVLGCHPGRETEGALILNFYGHQLVLHASDDLGPPQVGIYPRHFGLIFAERADWDGFIERIRARGLAFHIAPKLRFPGQLTEHWSCFLADPARNLLEFKQYSDSEAIFGARDCAHIGDLAPASSPTREP